MVKRERDEVILLSFFAFSCEMKKKAAIFTAASQMI
jgi:hypothetical protein